jgi:hypothetical protein
MSDNNNNNTGNAAGSSDPLKDLETRIAGDQSVAFEPEVIEALAELRSNNRAKYESLRAKLQATGFRRMAALEKALDAVSDENEQPPSQADILNEIANSAELFHTPDMTGYADIDINGHRETWPVRSRGFRRWLIRQFLEATEDAPNSEAMTTALNKIEASAHFDAPERAVYIRVGEQDGKVYLDLCDQTIRRAGASSKPGAAFRFSVVFSASER